MSKRKGDFRSKIDNILTEGPDGEAQQQGEPNELDSMLSGGDETVRMRRGSDETVRTSTRAAGARSGQDPLAKLVAPTTETKLDQIDIAKVTLPAHHNLEPTNLQELASSIASRGILMPLLLRPTREGYEVVDGGKRLIAARALGMTSVPAVVRELSDEQVAAAIAERAAASSEPMLPAETRPPALAGAGAIAPESAAPVALVPAVRARKRAPRTARPIASAAQVAPGPEAGAAAVAAGAASAAGASAAAAGVGSAATVATKRAAGRTTPRAAAKAAAPASPKAAGKAKAAGRAKPAARKTAAAARASKAAAKRPATKSTAKRVAAKTTTKRVAATAATAATASAKSGAKPVSKTPAKSAAKAAPKAATKTTARTAPKQGRRAIAAGASKAAVKATAKRKAKAAAKPRAKAPVRPPRKQTAAPLGVPVALEPEVVAPVEPAAAKPRRGSALRAAIAAARGVSASPEPTVAQPASHAPTPKVGRDDTVITFGEPPPPEAPAAAEPQGLATPAAAVASDETVLRPAPRRRGKGAATASAKVTAPPAAPPEAEAPPAEAPPVGAPPVDAEPTPMPAPPRPIGPVAGSFPQEDAEGARIAAAVATSGEAAPALARPSRTRALVQWYLMLVVVAAVAFAATNFLFIGDFTIGMWSAVVCVIGVITVAFLALTNRS